MKTLDERISEINKIYEDCKEPNWNSYDCPAITIKMRDNAIKLITLIYPIAKHNRVSIVPDAEGGIAFMFYIDKDNKLASWWVIEDEGLNCVWTPIPFYVDDEETCTFNGMYYKPLIGKTGHAKCSECNRAIKEAENECDN